MLTEATVAGGGPAVAGGALSARQRLMIDEMRRQNIPVIVAFTLASAIHFMRRHLLC